MSLALIGGDIAKVLRLASEQDMWLSAHLCDLFAKLGLLDQPFDGSDDQEISFRDFFILQYTDMLLSDPRMWRLVIDYLASLDNLDIGRGRMRDVLLSLGSTAKVGDGDLPKSADATAEGAAAEDTGDKAAMASKVSKYINVEDVLEACAQYGLEDATLSLCLVGSLPGRAEFDG